MRTVEGNIMHKRAHDGPQIETRKNLVVSRQMKVYSKYLGISGICDVVEFKKCKMLDSRKHQIIFFIINLHILPPPVQVTRGR